MTTNDLAHQIALLTYAIVTNPARLCQSDGAAIVLQRDELVREYGRRAVLGAWPTVDAFTVGLAAAFPGMDARAKYGKMSTNQTARFGACNANPEPDGHLRISKGPLSE